MTQKLRILNTMYRSPNKRFKVADFQKPFLSRRQFIGYEAGTRLCDLVRHWVIEKRESEKIIKWSLYPHKYIEYKINPEWIMFIESGKSSFRWLKKQ